MSKLLQINSNANIGSTGCIAEQIGESAIQHGWNSYIAYGREVRHSKSNLIKIGRKIDWLFHAFMTRLTDRHGLFSTRATRKLVKQIEEIRPDVIHLHNIHGYYINYRVLFDYLSKANIPVVWTLHDCWPMTGHCSYFTFVKCEQWKTQCYNCLQKGDYPASLLIDRSRKNYIEKRKLFISVKNMTIVPVSKWLGGIVKESYLGKYDVEVIHNGIDVEKFAPIADAELRSRYGIATEKKIVLGVASPWSKRKGLSDFVKLNDLLPRDTYQIVMIGLSEQQQRELPNAIIGLQRTSSVEDLAVWYSMADVFVNPTYEDTYPTTNLEAISCGTPVVTYKTGGSPESVTPQTGRVVETGNIEAVAKVIEKLCAEDRDAIRKCCRECAVAHFDKQECFKRYIDLYKSIIKK